MLQTNLYARESFENGERCLIFYFLYSTIEIRKKALTRRQQLQAVIRKNEYIYKYDHVINKFVKERVISSGVSADEAEAIVNNSRRIDLMQQYNITPEEITDTWKELDVEPIIDEINSVLQKEMGFKKLGVDIKEYKDVKYGDVVLDQLALGCYEVSDTNNFEKLSSPVTVDGVTYQYKHKMQLEDVNPNFVFYLDLTPEGKAIQPNS